MSDIRFSDIEVNKILEIKKKTMSNCQLCNNTGWVEDNPCSCRKSFLFFKELVYSRIPKEYWFRSFEEIEILPAVQKIVIKKYINNLLNAKEKGMGVCFMGTNGVGKTSMLAEIGKEGIALGLSVIYVTAQNYIDYMMKNDYENIERVVKKSDIVLFDELDKPYQKKGSDYVIAKIEDFFRETLPRDVMVCVGTNWTEEEVTKSFGDSVYSIMQRKIKFLPLEGRDISDKLQKNWLSELENSSEDFSNNPKILKFSERMTLK